MANVQSIQRKLIKGGGVVRGWRKIRYIFFAMMCACARTFCLHSSKLALATLPKNLFFIIFQHLPPILQGFY